MKEILINGKPLDEEETNPFGKLLVTFVFILVIACGIFLFTTIQKTYTLNWYVPTEIMPIKFTVPSDTSFDVNFKSIQCMNQSNKTICFNITTDVHNNN